MNLFSKLFRSRDKLDDFLKEQIDLIVLAFGKPDVVNEDSIDEYMGDCRCSPYGKKTVQVDSGNDL